MHGLFHIHVHGFALATFVQHLFFDSIAAAGGWYARRFCEHSWHRIAVAVGFTLISTFTLVTLIG